MVLPVKTKPKEPSYTMRIERIIMQVDLRSSKSIIEAMKKETLYLALDVDPVDVPKHIIAFDYGWEEALKSVRDFANMPPEEQEQERSRWKKLPRWKKQVFEKRIEHLAIEREKIKKKYSSVPQENPSTVQHSRRTVSPESVPEDRDKDDDDEEFAKFLAEHRRSFFNGIRTGRQSLDTNQQQSTNVDQDDNPPADPTTPSSVSLFSEAECRQELIDRAEALKQTSNKRRKIGEHANSVYQQGDSKSTQAIEASLTAGATALDTVYFPDRSADEPTVRMAIMVLNEIERTSTDGGVKAGTRIRAKCPSLTVLTRHSTDIKPIALALRECTREEETANNAFSFRPLTADGRSDGNTSLKEIVGTYIEKSHRARRNPQTSQVSQDEVVLEIEATIPPERRANPMSQ